MNTESLKTWKALTEPTVKICWNCKYDNRNTWVEPCKDCSGARGDDADQYIDKWEWNGE